MPKYTVKPLEEGDEYDIECKSEDLKIWNISQILNNPEHKIEDTLVAIGLTWPSRFMVRENHNTHNITPGTTRYLERIYRDEEVTTAGYMIIKKYVE